MPFIPHTESDIKEMLKAVGTDSIAGLFNEIPPTLCVDKLNIPDGLSEMQAARLIQTRTKLHQIDKCFTGAGAYEHHIPKAVWDITLRGEFLTAYTPYQAEASQGTLQLLFEYQTMIASLMGQEVSNASLYDGASALSEAILMACRLQRKKTSHSVWVGQNLNPFYRATLKTILKGHDINLVEVPFDAQGLMSLDALNTTLAHHQVCDVLVVSQPNFFGCIEDVHAQSDFAHANSAIVVGVANPIASALLAPPGQWGTKGADIACGEGQPLGIPLSGGGPYVGFLCTRKEYVRQLPGRIVGKTTDSEGKTGFTLTLQAREQHIRREKATSNICTNQGLLVTAATIYMSLLGSTGLKRVATSCYERCQFLIKQLATIGLKPLFAGEHFHEVAVTLPVNVQSVIEHMANKGYAAGFNLETVYPQLKNALLICVTETKTDEDIIDYVNCLKEMM
ncbi:MAG: aminomethyl-transferring glycine dehydrogenase subunit GcvPA [Proteobacteria bacterium]|nr:aminomethyl-transferring glycine dehydrogenase subunit GcvPA [Pseudomonadota bacterium]